MEEEDLSTSSRDHTGEAPGCLRLGGKTLMRSLDCLMPAAEGRFGQSRHVPRLTSQPCGQRVALHDPNDAEHSLLAQRPHAERHGAVRCGERARKIETETYPLPVLQKLSRLEIARTTARRF